MTNRIARSQAIEAIRRWWGPAIMTLAATATLSTLAAAAPPGHAAVTQARPPQPGVTTAQRDAGEPVMAIVSIKSQQVTIYDAEGWILRAPVSTGTTGRETPAGVFSVVEKEKDHHSNLYDDASMPNMQRITWSGIAMHGGPLPGHAASHGCVRLPYDFAENLFDKTPMGMRVIISPEDAEPIAFSDPALFGPNADAIAAAPGRAEKLAAEATEAAKAADDAKKAAVEAQRSTAALTASIRKAEFLKSRADAEFAFADKVIAGARANQAKAEEQKQKIAAKAQELATQLDTAKADVKSKAGTAGAPPDPMAARETAALTASLRKLEMLKARADAEVAGADRVLAAANANLARAEDQKQKAAAKAAEFKSQLDTAKAESKAKLDAAAAAQSGTKAAEARRTETAKAARDAKLALEPVSLFISRKTQRIYVRHGIEPGYDLPVTIRNPDKPLGTHIFTAMARTDGGLRWTAVTIDNGDEAKAALDRITIPQEVLDRVAPTAMPRSSIVISDEPLNRETNYRTEFVVVLNNQPQGGLAVRKPANDLGRGGWGGGDFFSGFFGGFGGDSRYAARGRGGRDYYQNNYYQRQW
jgi:lipoprotein-anchoring transpeptidase ErfK/SrfK